MSYLIFFIFSIFIIDFSALFHIFFLSFPLQEIRGIGVANFLMTSLVGSLEFILKIDVVLAEPFD